MSVKKIPMQSKKNVLFWNDGTSVKQKQNSNGKWNDIPVWGRSF
jgi:hypothetical protein